MTKDTDYAELAARLANWIHEHGIVQNGVKVTLEFVRDEDAARAAYYIKREFEHTSRTPDVTQAGFANFKLHGISFAFVGPALDRAAAPGGESAKRVERGEGEVEAKLREIIAGNNALDNRLFDAVVHAADALASLRDHGASDRQVFFYEREFYPLSNFSAFRIAVETPVGMGDFDTSEQAYHYFKFPGEDVRHVRSMIRRAQSAHDAFKIAEQYRNDRRADWDAVKVDVMRGILRAKADQHEYVRRKLVETGSRELIENSWRDDFWGWGPNKDGQNMLGKLWMEVRATLTHPDSEKD